MNHFFAALWNKQLLVGLVAFIHTLHWLTKLWSNSPNDIIATTSKNIIPKGWKTVPTIVNDIIEACPFCTTDNNNTCIRIENLEHLHLYCKSALLIDVWSHCHQEIENASVNYTIMLQSDNIITKILELLCFKKTLKELLCW